MELKPCPFCGGEADIARTRMNDAILIWYIAYCTECQCRTRDCNYQKEAATAWNARPENS